MTYSFFNDKSESNLFSGARNWVCLLCFVFFYFSSSKHSGGYAGVEYLPDRLSRYRLIKKTNYIIKSNKTRASASLMIQPIDATAEGPLIFNSLLIVTTTNCLIIRLKERENPTCSWWRSIGTIMPRYSTCFHYHFTFATN